MGDAAEAICTTNHFGLGSCPPGAKLEITVAITHNESQTPASLFAFSAAPFQGFFEVGERSNIS